MFFLTRIMMTSSVPVKRGEMIGLLGKVPAFGPPGLEQWKGSSGSGTLLHLHWPASHPCGCVC